MSPDDDDGRGRQTDQHNLPVLLTRRPQIKFKIIMFITNVGTIELCAFYVCTIFTHHPITHTIDRKRWLANVRWQKVNTRFSDLFSINHQAKQGAKLTLTVWNTTPRYLTFIVPFIKNVFFFVQVTGKITVYKLEPYTISYITVVRNL